MPTGASSSVPSSSNGTAKDRPSRPTPAGPRKRSDTKSELRPHITRHQSSNTASSNAATTTGPSTSSISVNRSQSIDPVNPQRREVMAGTSSRNRTSSKDAQATQPPPRSLSSNKPGLPESPLGGSPASNAGRNTTIKTTISPTSSPTPSSPLLSASLGRAPSSRLGPSAQRSYESFADFRANSAQRRTTAGDSQASPSSHSHFQPSPGASPSTSESFRVHSSSSRVGSQASASASRKSSGTGTGSDREGGGHLDLKRLLSKPALPNHSGSSIISLLSDPEPSASPSASRRLMTAQAQAHDILRQRTMTSPNPPRPLRERPSARSMSAVAEFASQPMGRAGIRDITTRGSLLPPSRDSERERERESNSKPRTVLKRKPSSRAGPSTPTVATYKLTQTDSFSSNETSRASSSHQPARSSDTARPAATSTSSSASRRVGSATADPISVRGGLRESAPPVGLTPAGAVVHAYKQQEERREKLAEMSGWNEHQRQTLYMRPSQSSLSSLSFASLVPTDASDSAVDVTPDLKAKEEEPSGPYYTVFGSASDRLVAANTRGEDWQLNFDSYYGCGVRTEAAATVVSPKPASGHGSGSSSGMKGLSRKMSGKFRKVTGTGRGSREDSPQRSLKADRKDTVEGVVVNKSWMPYDGRVSMSKERGGLSLEVGRASSVDGFVKVEIKDTISPTMSHSPTNKSDAPKRLFKPPRTDDREKQKQKDREEEGSQGAKLWKLMKRISTGGLRDKYHITRDSSPPPVPALPKDILPSRLTLDIQKPPSDELVGESGILLSRFMQSRSSMSGVRPSTAPQRSVPRAETDPRSRPSTATKADPRPSTTTRSSSPMSSDIASARFFQKTHSNRSSTTSYGEELPPLPSTSSAVPVFQHIISPSELSRLDRTSDDLYPHTPNSSRRKPARSRSVPDDPPLVTSPVEDLRPSLPFPPRRPAQSLGGKPSHSPPSPTIPAFNNTEAVNIFPSPPALSLTMSEFGVSSDAPRSAPPRPRKNSRRHPASDRTVSSASTVKPSPTSSSPRTPILPSLSIDVFSRTRRSISGSSRSHPRDPPLSPSPASASPQVRSPLTFRDIESPRTALSEREKAVKWDDLLEKSARAGGTLHLGETGLMSDNLRFSVVSES